MTGTNERTICTEKRWVQNRIQRFFIYASCAVEAVSKAFQHADNTDLMDKHRLYSIDYWNIKKCVLLLICENQSNQRHLRAFETSSAGGA
jgi:methionine salvage enolase-phosphatase E1